MLNFLLLFIIFSQLVFLLYLFYHHKKEKQEIISSFTENLEDIIKITETLRSSLELDKIFIEILNIFSKKFGYKKVFIYLIEKTHQEVNFKCIACPGLVSTEGVGIYSFVINDTKDPVFSIIENFKNHQIDLTSFLLPKLKEKLKLSEFFLLPIILKDNLEGIIITEKPLDPKLVLPLKIFANECGVALENAKLFKKVQEMSITDSLTGVFNRRYFEERLPEEIELARRYKSFLSLCILDIDYFKHYNDINGHLAGDKCLKKVAEIISTTLRSGDVVFRYGGEEFVVLLPATDKNGAFIACEKIRKNIETYPFEYREKQPSGKLTVSIGLSVYPVDATEKITLIKVADENLYRAKSSGKNKVCCL
ncbi:MAG: GGDEF domain-containing protein [Elusimicrobiota bacterium]|nr:GGDEF domain-containing protein [Endomicrobiia bacterium]MDW8165574.1 GGDEF domain-containing protein [Elusimicrobiota bacterium]